MTTTINASNSGSGGLVQTADASGVLALQTAGVTAVTVDASQNAALAANLSVAGTLTSTGYANLPNTFGFKNRIINGAMVIDQRNAGASVTPANNQYLVDRWQAAANVASKFSVQQSTTTATGFVNSMLATSLSAYSIGAAELCALRQSIEGLNVGDLGWGTANAQTVTVSFWVRSSLTGTFGGSIMNGATDRSYPFTYTISTANTFEYKTVTIAGDTSGTWLKTNGIGLSILFGLGVGTSFSGTAGAWAGASYYGATGATSVVGTNGATFYITGVQLEKGSTATSFDYRSIGQELALCQRYCQYAGSGSFGSFDGSTAVTIQITEKCVVPMRVAPSGSIISGVTAAFRSTGSDFSTASPTLANFTANTSNYGGTSFWTQVNTFSGGTANSPVTGRNNQPTNGGNFILLTAEL